MLDLFLSLAAVTYVVATTPSCGPGSHISGKTCVSCSPGYYQSQSNQQSCVAASLGYHVSGTGATSQTECSPGSFSSAAASTGCTSCDPGSYQSQWGASTCTQAQGGWYATGPGATSELQCGEGYYSTAGSSSCTTCPPGYYCGSSTTTTPVICPPGHFSTGGAGQQCSECPKGSFTSISGATGCCQCCTGTYVDQTGSNWCYPCTPSGYSAPGSSSASACTGLGSGSSTCGMDGNLCPNPGNPPPSSRSRREPRGLWCPKIQKSCPIYGVNRRGQGYVKGYECVTVATDLESCGGCVGIDSPRGEVTEDGGRDCSAIPNVDGVSCQRGRCNIDSCRLGYNVTVDRQECLSSVLGELRFQ